MRVLFAPSLFCGALLSVASACQSKVPTESPDLTAAQRNAIADTVQKAGADFLAAIDHVDADKLAGFAKSGADFTAAMDDGTIIRSSEAFSRDLKDGWKSVRSQHARLDSSRIAVQSPTVAVQTMSVGGSVTDTSGKTRLIDKAAFTLVWVREPSGWKLLSYHQSFAPPKTQ